MSQNEVTAATYVEATFTVALGSQLTASLPDHLTRGDINALVRRAVELTPSSFNSQSTRVLLLFGKLHRLFWQRLIGLAVSHEKEAMQLTEQVVPAACTVVLCEDNDAVRKIQTAYPRYASMLPGHAEQGSAMTELAIVSALGCEGVSTVARHYRLSLQEDFEDICVVPHTWEMKAQIACGQCLKQGFERETLSDDHYFKVIHNA